MALFLLKPILWNTQNYKGPSGWKVSGESYPALHGFGHEEWNNADRLGFEERGQRYRTFHTERVGNAATDENRGQTFVFMIASHDRVQQLVGVAGNAQYLRGDEKERERIVKKLNLAALGDEAWQLDGVKAAFGRSKVAFNAEWRRCLPSLCNWICPEEFFWWPNQPITLQANEVRGKSSLAKMFSAYMPLQLSEAEQIMGMVPIAQRGAEWLRLVDAMRVAPDEPLPPSGAGGRSPAATTRLSLSLARIGQGKFRQDLLDQWGHACAVTGLTQGRVLRASHVLPWKDSNNKQRLDPDNGLILSANLDTLFDAGLISFAANGTMLVSRALGPSERKELGLPMKLRKTPNAALRAYLAQHAERFGFKGTR